MDDTDPEFFNYLFHTESFLSEVKARSRGIVPDRDRLYWDAFKQISLPCPGIVEQQAIANHMDRIDQLVTQQRLRLGREIELMQEYRTRLISDVVTGKVKVP